MLDGRAPVQSGDVLLGRYRVEHVLGQGGMGVVVAARHLNLGELFAIKFLLPNAVENPQAVERFLREARAAARLKSEHVAKVVDVGTLETLAPYMVMEHLAGSDLRELLRKRGPLPVDEAVTYVLQACDALEEAHSLGIVHRDLKPANLFLTRRPNGSPCVKVLDFGISKQLGGENVDLTSTHASFGSPLYMSPEQMTRAKSADTRTDIWSMGIVLYELVTATTPFLAESVTEVVGRVLQEAPARPSQVRSDLPPWLDAAILGCLQKPRERRFQTIREFVTALAERDVAATMPLSRAPVAPVPATTMPLSGVSAPRQAQSPAQEPRTAQTDSAWGQTAGNAMPLQRRLGRVVAIGSLALVVIAGGTWFGFRGSERPGAGATTPSLNEVAAPPTVSALPPRTAPSPTATALPTQAPSGTAAAPVQSFVPTAAAKAPVPARATGRSSPSPTMPAVSTGNTPAPPKPTHEPLD